MEFRQGGESEAVLLPPRSLLIMAGPARYCWHHYIPHRKADPMQGGLLPRAPRRMSFTFRKVVISQPELASLLSLKALSCTTHDTSPYCSRLAA